jgi:hypothetical protein
MKKRIGVWFFRIYFGLIVGAIALVAIYLIVGHIRLNSRLRAIARAGEPTSLTHYAPKLGLKDTDNALWHFQQIGQRLEPLQKADRDFSILEPRWAIHADHAPMPEWRRRHLRSLRSLYEAEILAIEAASRLAAERTWYDPNTPVYAWDVAQHLNLWSSAYALTIDASLALDEGDSARFVSRVQTILDVASLLDGMDETIAVLMGNGLHGRAHTLIREAAHRIDVSQVGRDRIERLLQTLLNAPDDRDRAIRAMMFERVATNTAFANLGRGGRFMQFVSPYGRAIGLDYHSESIRIARTTRTLEAVRSAWTSVDAIKQKAEHRRMANFAMFAANHDRLLTSAYHVLADRRVAAATLAAVLFMHDHGRAPTSLGELVPGYLPEPPIDPMDGQPLRYDPHRLLIWSIGPDLTDDQGTMYPPLPPPRPVPHDIVGTLAPIEHPLASQFRDWLGDTSPAEHVASLLEGSFDARLVPPDQTMRLVVRRSGQSDVELDYAFDPFTGDPSQPVRVVLRQDADGSVMLSIGPDDSRTLWLFPDHDARTGELTGYSGFRMADSFVVPDATIDYLTFQLDHDRIEWRLATAREDAAGTVHTEASADLTRVEPAAPATE